MAHRRAPRDDRERRGASAIGGAAERDRERATNARRGTSERESAARSGILPGERPRGAGGRASTGCAREIVAPKVGTRGTMIERPSRDAQSSGSSTGSAPGGVPPARVKFVVLARVGFSFRRARRPNAPSTVSHFSTLSYLHLLTYAPLPTPIYAPRPPPTRVIPPPAPPRRPGTARTRSP